MWPRSLQCKPFLMFTSLLQSHYFSSHCLLSRPKTSNRRSRSVTCNLPALPLTEQMGMMAACDISGPYMKSAAHHITR